MATETERSEQQAKAQLEGIVSMVCRLQHCRECDDAECGLDNDSIMAGLNLVGQATSDDRELYHDEEAAQQAITDDPLSIEVRSAWRVPGTEPEGGEYLILLCTGGPAVRIIGDLSTYNEPETATIEYQDWFTPWIELGTTDDEDKALLTYAAAFYFG